jgi:hypothetical protein
MPRPGFDRIAGESRSWGRLCGVPSSGYVRGQAELCELFGKLFSDRCRSSTMEFDWDLRKAEQNLAKLSMVFRSTKPVLCLGIHWRRRSQIRYTLNQRLDL